MNQIPVKLTGDRLRIARKIAECCATVAPKTEHALDCFAALLGHAGGIYLGLRRQIEATPGDTQQPALDAMREFASHGLRRMLQIVDSGNPEVAAGALGVVVESHELHATKPEDSATLHKRIAALLAPEPLGVRAGALAYALASTCAETGVTAEQARAIVDQFAAVMKDQIAEFGIGKAHP